MTDLELLELAAKAAGIPIVSCTCSDKRWPFKHDEAKSGKRGHWNPLVDDGDALRLAVQAGVDISFAQAVHHEETGSAGYRADPHAFTRRAIVRAAAEIGWAQEHKESQP